ncbi:MAG TPA: iron-siderophore ABC transporter substrate-binding protein, partial [Caldilineaceae bacterium]|nr:iron-siderophore ABC transporter substrate-binding protein [Caldilineaceae bacterium]
MGTATVTCAPQRVVTLEQGATDAALALGVTPVGAVDPWGDKWYGYLADQVQGVAAVGAETEPNLETIALLDPDLIIGSRLRHEAIYDQLQQIAPTVFSETIGRTWKANFQLYAQALCREEKGAELIAAWEQRIADFRAKMGDRLNTEVSLVRFRAGEVRIY